MSVMYTTRDGESREDHAMCDLPHTAPKKPWINPLAPSCRGDDGFLPNLAYSNAFANKQALRAFGLLVAVSVFLLVDAMARLWLLFTKQTDEMYTPTVWLCVRGFNGEHQ